MQHFAVLDLDICASFWFLRKCFSSTWAISAVPGQVSTAIRCAIDSEPHATFGLDVLLRHRWQTVVECLRECRGSPFQILVLKLLTAIGYGGAAEDAAVVVRKPGDGGIDGIIRQDKLGLDLVYVQAKRWHYHTLRYTFSLFNPLAELLERPSWISTPVTLRR